MEMGARFAGVELYFNDLKKARAFYADTLGLQISDEDPQRYAKFSAGAGTFFCWSVSCNAGKSCLLFLLFSRNCS